MYVVSVSLLSVLFYVCVRQFYREHVIQDLNASAVLVSQVCLPLLRQVSRGEPAAELQEAVSAASMATGVRVTVIAPDGTVLADSHQNPRLMENHGNRPEVREALSGARQSSVRFSSTLGRELMYLAIPVVAEGKVIGALRVSTEMSQVTAAEAALWKRALAGLVVVLTAAMIAIWLQSRRVTQRLAELVHECNLVRQGELHRAIYVSGTDEIAQLGSSISAMVATIRDKIDLLEQTRVRLQGILDNTPNGVVLLDSEFKVLIANNASVKMLSLPAEALANRSFLETIRNWDVWRAVEEAARTGNRVVRQVELPRPAGTWLEVSVIPLAGGKQGYLVIMNDISQLKRVERMRADFVANVSHELRTPLTSIQGFAETLLSAEHFETAATREFLQIIQEEAQRLRRIVESLLELSKLESGAVKPRIQEVDIRSLVQGVGRLMEGRAKSAGLKLEVKVAGVADNVFSDPDMIRDSLLELLHNAVKYTPSGGSILLEAETVRDHSSVPVARLSVEDTGVGIPEEELPRIFERFYRVDRARDRRSGGTGLGLSIVKHRMELLGGRVEVVSTVGRGSRFTLVVPSLVPLEAQS